MIWIYRFFRKSVIGLQMKKRTTVMAARFSFVWMFPNFLLLSPNSGSFLSELFSEPNTSFSELSLQ